ncbi:TPR domain protein, putative component of TonB system [Chitinispirillum alkaliphilum]|nr:TPR domain protein, putative component of TonB system [Chitinispirillum alkaliphilum]
MRRQIRSKFVLLFVLLGVFDLCAGSVDYIHYRLGVKYKNENKLDFAIDEFRKVLAAYPDNHNAYMHLAEIYQKRENPRLVVYYLREALKYNPGWGRAHGMLAAAYESDGQYQRAVMELQQYLQSADPAQRDSIQGAIDNLIGQMSGGGVRQRREETQPAVAEEAPEVAREDESQETEETEVVIEKKQEEEDPRVAEMFERVKNLYNDEEFEKAIEEIRALLKINPGHPGAYYYAGLIRRHNGQNRMARINFQRSVAYREKGYRAHYHLGEIFGEKENYSDAIRHLNTFITRSEDQEMKERARELLERLKAHVPADVAQNIEVVDSQRYTPIEIRIDSLLSMMTVDTLTDVGQKLLGGIRLFKAGDFDGAVTEFRRILLENPTGTIAANCIYNIGVCYYKLRLFNDSKNQFEQFLERFPNHQFAPKSLFLKTMSIQERSDYETAERLWRQFIQKYRTHDWTPMAYERLGDAYVHMVDKRRAVDAYTRSISLSSKPSDIVAVNFKLGEVYSTLGNFSRAINSYNAAIQTGESNDVYLRVPDSYYKMADLHFREGNFEQALALYQRVTRKYPSFHETAWGVFQIGNVLKNQRRFEEAIAKYRDVIERFPDDYWARQAQWKLEDTVWEYEHRAVLERAKRN